MSTVTDCRSVFAQFGVEMDTPRPIRTVQSVSDENREKQNSNVYEMFGVKGLDTPRPVRIKSSAVTQVTGTKPDLRIVVDTTGLDTSAPQIKERKKPNITDVKRIRREKREKARRELAATPSTLPLGPRLVAPSPLLVNHPAYQNYALNPVLDRQYIITNPENPNMKEIIAAFDAEFKIVVERAHTFITVQVALSEKRCVVLEHPQAHVYMGQSILPTWYTETVFATIFGFQEESILENEVSQKIGSDEKVIDLNGKLFFSFSDLIACFGRRIAKFIQLYSSQKARLRVDIKRRRKEFFPKKKSVLITRLILPVRWKIDDEWHHVRLKLDDFARLTGNTGGLKKTGRAFGLQMEEKSYMDKYKENMFEPYQDEGLFAEYLDYAASDATVLFQIEDAALNMQNSLFKIHDLPGTDKAAKSPGLLVSNLFIQYLEKFVGDYDAAKLFTYKFHTAKGVRAVTWSLEDILDKVAPSYFSDLKNYNKSAACLSLLQGGYPKNLKPTERRFSGVIGDLDKKGAYSNLMNDLEFPIGLPYIESYPLVTKGRAKGSRVRLKHFLKTNKKNFSGKNWLIIVSGKLTFDQTLVHSKIAGLAKIVDEYDPDNAKIDAPFILNTREIRYGVITHYNLQVIDAVATNREKMEFYNLFVDAAIWYLKSERCETPQEWYEAVQRDHEGKEFLIEDRQVKGKRFFKDNRSRKWLAVPLKDFLQPYNQARKDFKEKMKSFPEGSDNYNYFDAQQDFMKTVRNTLYGSFGSSIMPIGNSLMGNVITSGVRTGIWLDSIAMNFKMIITDGGPYDVNRVLRFSGKHMPGFNFLAKLRDETLLTKDDLKNSGLRFSPLGNHGQWSIQQSDQLINEEDPDLGYKTTLVAEDGTAFENVAPGQWNGLDELADEHIRLFWGRYGRTMDLLFLSEYEHKDVYQEVVTASQTNYMFKRSDGKSELKARGNSLHKQYYSPDGKLIKAPIQQLFEQLSLGGEIHPIETGKVEMLLKVDVANDLLMSHGTPNPVQVNNLLAGESIYKKSRVTVISLSQFYWQTWKQYKSWNEVEEFLKDEYGWGMEAIYFNPDTQKIEYDRALQEIQWSIEQGLNFLPGWKYNPKLSRTNRLTHLEAQAWPNPYACPES